MGWGVSGFSYRSLSGIVIHCIYRVLKLGNFVDHAHWLFWRTGLNEVIE